MSRTYAAEDADFISARMRELEDERLAVFRCSCDTAVGPKGETIYILSASCPVHRIPYSGDCG